MIAKIVTVAIVSFAALGCSASPEPAVAGQAKAKMEVNEPVAQPFAPATPSKTYFENPLEIAEWLRSDFPESAEGRQRLEVSLEQLDDAKYHLYVRKLGLLDDSVSARQHRATIVRKAEGWQMLSLEENWRCARSAKPSEWVTTSCP
jgi:hypothetical protein